MLNDNALFEGPSDIVAQNVTTLPDTAAVYSLFYLTAQDRTYVPGLYFFLESKVWVLLSNSDPVTD